MRLINIFFLVIVTLLSSCSKGNWHTKRKFLKYSIFLENRDKTCDFEEASNTNNDSCNVVRLFFDRRGNLYPGKNADKVNFEKFKNNNYLINYQDSSWPDSFENEYEKKFNEVVKALDISSKGEERVKKRTKALANIVESNLKTWDSLFSQKNDFNFSHYSSITFLSIGYNNFYGNTTDGNSDDRSEKNEKYEGKSGDKYFDNKGSFDKMSVLRDSISRKAGLSPNHLFIEVHWDGGFIQKKGLKVARNHKIAIQNTHYIGMALRNLLNEKIVKPNDNVKQINFISHSSAANLFSQLHFNIESKINRKARLGLGPETRLWEDLQLMYQVAPEKYPTTDKWGNNDSLQINTSLLAPSMPGYKTFEDFLKRSEPNSIDARDRRLKHHNFYIGFNSFDPSLKKKFGGSFVSGLLNSRDGMVKSRAFHSTALGCLESEADEVDILFRKYNLFDNFHKIDFSYSLDGTPNTNHNTPYYINTKGFSELMSEMY